MATSAIKRLSSQELEALVGAPAVKLLKNRVRGGNSGFKGTRFEEFFGAHRIARLSRKLLASGADPQVEWQSNNFVDDFVVRNDHAGALKGFQLKNSPTVSWTADDPSIQQDFETQYLVSKAEGYKEIRLRLVCSDPQTAEALRNAVPQAIQQHSKALHFPYDQSPRMTIVKHGWLADDFAFLSKKENPEPIEVENVASVMMGAWAMTAPTARVSEVIGQARQMSPTLIRSFEPDRGVAELLQPAVRQILDRIPDFQYAIKRGFFQWSSPTALTSGVLAFDCYTAEFGKWQNQVLQLNPQNFEDLEDTL